jgi:hypothetical protein
MGDGMGVGVVVQHARISFMLRAYSHPHGMTLRISERRKAPPSIPRYAGGGWGFSAFGSARIHISADRLSPVVDSCVFRRFDRFNSTKT